VLNPPFVFGPPIHSVAKVSDLNTSVADWYNTVLTQGPTTATPAKLTAGSVFIDVRDLGVAHVRVLEESAAGGERFIIASSSFVWQDWINATNALPKDVLDKLANPSELPKGDPARDSSHPEAKIYINYNTEKAARVLGLGPRSLAKSENFTTYLNISQCAQGMVEEFAKRGW